MIIHLYEQLLGFWVSSNFHSLFLTILNLLLMNSTFMLQQLNLVGPCIGTMIAFEGFVMMPHDVFLEVVPRVRLVFTFVAPECLVTDWIINVNKLRL